jgi:hypothetical protein
MKKQEVGSEGYTDLTDKRMDKIAELIAIQKTQSRSKRMLIVLFENLARVKAERERYTREAGAAGMRSLAWADGYLTGTLEAINYYLDRRFGVSAITLQEAEMIVERPDFTHLSNASSLHPQA